MYAPRDCESQDVYLKFAQMACLLNIGIQFMQHGALHPRGVYQDSGLDESALVFMFNALNVSSRFNTPLHTQMGTHNHEEWIYYLQHYMNFRMHLASLGLMNT